MSMDTEPGAVLTVESYIAAQPAEVQVRLEAIRATIHGVIADVEERISYGIPTFTVDQRAVLYVAAWKRHLSIYPVPDGDADFQLRIAPRRAAKGTLRFPLNDFLDLDLVGAVASWAAAEART
jgi:uncharacterized protein YdhG (YjbR/CyaY superfamily)